MSQPTFEQQAIAMIAAELPIRIVFVSEDAAGVCYRSSPVQPNSYEEIAGSLQALLIPPSLPPAVVTEGGIRRLAFNGHVPHLNGYIMIIAGEFCVTGKLAMWVRSASEAWKQLVEDHVAALNSTGTVAAPQKEYLAARFSTDETNLWLLAEESGEVVRSCGKLGRWGYDHVHQVTGESGMRLLEAEVGDFLAIVDIMVARGHFTEEALESAKQAKLKRLEDWYEAPWTPADMEPVAPSPATHSAKERIESGYLVQEAQQREKPKFNVLRLDGSSAQGWLMEEPALPCGRRRMALDTDQLIWAVCNDDRSFSETTPPNRPANAAYYKERAELHAKAMFPFGSPAGVPRPDVSSYSHISPSEAPPVSGGELPRTSEGYLDWKALDGDLTTVKQGEGNLLTVEVTRNGRMKVFTGVVAEPITFTINPASTCIP